jgi:glycosyltransferase involved in cell wall biosynthesis
LKRALKRARMLLPGSVADQVIAVSDFVARRKLRVDLLPAQRVKRVWNSVDISAPPAARAQLHQAFGIAEDRPVIVCASRAAPEKGLHLLLRAFDRLVQEGPIAGGAPVLIYMGDGPELPALRELREALPAREDMVLAGYVERASELIAGAELCVVPSVWQEAFGLAALEPMASGVAVIASRVGGMAEIIIDGETGRLVPPGDEAALSQVMRELLADPGERARLGANGRRRALEAFSREQQLDQLHAIVAAGFNGRMSNAGERLAQGFVE